MKAYKINDWLGWGGVHDIAHKTQEYDVVINVGIKQGISVHGKICRNNYFEDSPSGFRYDIITALAKEIEDYRKEGKKVFVNCHEGNSRSVSLVLAWMTMFGGYETTEAAFDALFKVKQWVTYDGIETQSKQPLRDWFQKEWPLYLAIHRGTGQWVPETKVAS